ncbi:MAG: NAD-binding protein [Ignavibacteria bacterium]|nr:NAD-binding protein [Ignavibacteria bacterium]
MGTHICNDLEQAKVPFVVIENNPDNKDKLDELEYLYDLGDASNDETLLRTGVKKAKGIVAVLSSDAENVFTTLSAKTLNPDIFLLREPLTITRNQN